MGDYRAMLNNLADVWRLHEMLRGGITSRQAIEMLRMSRSTFFRALRLLRALGAAIQYDRDTGTFRYGGPWDFWAALKNRILIAAPRARR